MSRNRISFTAQLAIILKSEKDSNYNYFISTKARRFYNIFSKAIPDKKIDELKKWRINISDEFDRQIKLQKPSQIIELGCGYSLRGFNMAKNNPDITYFDTDLQEIVRSKKNILLKLCREKKIKIPSNYHLKELDVLNDDFNFEKTINTSKKTLLIAEGLISYFSKEQYFNLMNNIEDIFNYHKDIAFFSHETIAKKSKFSSLIKGFKTLMQIKTYRRFENEDSLKQYLYSRFNVKDFYCKYQNYFYLLKN